MKLRLPLLLRLALLSTAAAYTLGSGCLFADDAPADAAQDDPIAEAVDEEESDSPAIGFEGYTESQLVDIQSSDSAGAVIRQMLENSTTGAVANVGTTSSTSNGATTAAESPAFTLSAPAEPVTDTTLTTSTLSDSAGEGAVAPFFSAEEAAALVVASPATSTPSLKNTSTATLSSSDTSDATTSSSSATGASSSLGSVGSSSSGGAGASSGGASASYSLTSSAPASSSSLVITTPTDDTSSDPIAEDILEDSTSEDTTTSTTLPDSSASTLASTTTTSTSSATTTSTTPRTLPALKLQGSTESSTPGTVTVDGKSLSSEGGQSNGVEFRWGKMGSGDNVNILYLHATKTFPEFVNVAADSFYIVPANSEGDPFSIGTLTTSNANSTIIVQNNEWTNLDQTGWALDLTIETLTVNGSANLNINKTQTGALGVKIERVENTLEDLGVPVLTSVTNSGTLTLGTNSSEGVAASSVSIGTLTNKANSTMTLNGVTTITENLTNNGTLTNTGTLTVNNGATLVGKINNGTLTNTGTLTVESGAILSGEIDSTGTLNLDGEWDLHTILSSGSGTIRKYMDVLSSGSSGTITLKTSGSMASVLDKSIATNGISLTFVGSDAMEINSITTPKLSLTVNGASTLKTEGALRIESTAKLIVNNGGKVVTAGALQLGHREGSSHAGYVELGDKGQITAICVEQTPLKDGFSLETRSEFTMTGGVLTLTQSSNGNKESFSGVNAVITGGVLDISKSSWGIDGTVASVKVGGVTVSNVDGSDNGASDSNSNVLTLKKAEITGNVTLEGTAGLVLKDVTVTGETVTLGGDGRTVQVASGGLTVEKSVTTLGNLEFATGNNLVVKGTYATSGAVSSLKLQGEATASLQNGETVVATVKKNGTEADASITGGVTMKYDSDSGKAVIEGGGNGSSATISNSLLTVANGSTLSLQNVILAGNTQISAGTAAAAAVALLDEGSGESSGTATTVDLSESVIQLSKDNAAPKPGSEGVGNLAKDTPLTKTGTTGGEGNTLPIQQDTAKVYTIDYTGATGVTLTGALTFDFDTFTVEGMTGSGYYLLNELLKEYDYVALRFADDVTVDPEKVAVTSKVTMGTETVTSAGYYAGGTNGVVNSNGTSGVVVYFDAMALPEPTTSTLGLLALAALCARRRRSRTRAHAE